MLIGQFCETYPPFLDGVGRVMLAYCETLTEMGHRSLYIAPRNPHFTYEYPGEALLYTGVPIHKQVYRFGLPWVSRSFWRAAKRMPFDVVHIHAPFLAGLAAQKMAQKRGVPVIGSFHSKYYDDFYRATNSRLVAKFCMAVVMRFFKGCDEVWAVNHRTADVLRGYGFRGEITIMPNGTNPLAVSDEEREAAFRLFPLREGVPILIFAGQLDLKKNINSVLQSCALLRDRGMDFQLILAGGGANADELKQLAGRLGMMDRVTFTGFIAHRPTLLALLERADLMVFPSLYDNAPMVVREAAALGTPSLLVEDSCSAEGIVHNENGFLCQNTAENIADAIFNALPLCQSVGEQAKITIPIPWDQIVEKAMARYENLIAHMSGSNRRHP